MGRTEWNALHIVSLQTIKENYFFFCHINANAANSQSKCICFFFFFFLKKINFYVGSLRCCFLIELVSSVCR
jgi:hypothetical protein